MSNDPTKETPYLAQAPSKRTDQLGFRPKRFWREVGIKATDGGFQIELDGRAVKTPMDKVLRLPNAASADLVAKEWHAIETHLDYHDMPFTRLGFTSLDRMAVAFEETLAEALNYAQTDLLAYPSDYPSALIAQEAALWSPMRDALASQLGFRLIPNPSIIHSPQPQEGLKALETHLGTMSAFERAGLMQATALLGSVGLGLGLWAGLWDGVEAYEAATIGERFQAQTWGEDAEAKTQAQSKKALTMKTHEWLLALK